MKAIFKAAVLLFACCQCAYMSCSSSSPDDCFDEYDVISGDVHGATSDSTNLYSLSLIDLNHPISRISAFGDTSIKIISLEFSGTYGPIYIGYGDASFNTEAFSYMDLP